MNVLLFIPSYFLWHYSKAIFDLLNLWKNLVVFFYEFFSIPTLLSTLFSPWHKMNSGYTGQLTFEATVGTFIVNTITRIIGAIVRLVFIVLGIICIFVAVAVGFLAFLAWLVLPVIVVYTFVSGFNYLLS